MTPHDNTLPEAAVNFLVHNSKGKKSSLFPPPSLPRFCFSMKISRWEILYSLCIWIICLRRINLSGKQKLSGWWGCKVATHSVLKMIFAYNYFNSELFLCRQ